MLKEMIISIIIVVSIVLLDVVTQRYTDESVSQTSSMLTDLKEKISRGEDDLNNNLKEIANRWDEKRKKLAYFIEHDELEKVDVNLTNLKSYIEVSDFDMAVYSIDEAEYILEHIKQKNSFSLVNVF